MFHRIVLVFALLVAVGCTGDDTVRVEVEKETQCYDGTVAAEGETCPSPPPVVTPTDPDPSDPDPSDTSDMGEPSRPDCNIKVQGVRALLKIGLRLKIADNFPFPLSTKGTLVIQS